MPSAPRDDHARRWRFASATRAALLALAAGCAGAGTQRPAPVPTPQPAPTQINCPLVTDSGAAPADTVRFVAEPRNSPAALAGCTNSAPSASPVVDSITVPRGGDLRDLLDRGVPAPGTPRVDVAVTRDPDALAYAAQLGTYRSIALPWDRAYALVAPHLDSVPVAPTADQRAALARDAVQADARAAEPPFWWESDTTCATAAPRYAGGAPRIVGYPADDPIARQLAERIVALASARGAPAWIPAALASPTDGPLRTTGFAPTALNDALASGQIAAFVAGFPRIRPAACSGAARIPAEALVIPLVDSRAHALLRRGSGAAFYIEADGTLRLVSNRTP